MNQSEYQNIFDNENSHFYYIGINKEILSLANKYFQQFNDEKEIKILDAGCGTGFLTKKIERFGKVTGVDIDLDAIKFAKKKGVNIIKASISNLPFKDNSFDIIISIDVLYHRNVNETQALKEFYRVLKPSGLLLLKLPAFNFLKGKHDLFVHAKRRYTDKSLSYTLQENGFQQIKSTYLASFLFFPALIKRSIERFFELNNQKAKSDLRMPFNVLNILLITLFNIENYILKFINLPFGLSVFSISKKLKE